MSDHESEAQRVLGWFGDLNLAYKYSIVFGTLLLITVILGLIRLISDKRKLNRFIKDIEAQEAEKRLSADNDQVELNMREKDEGDLFGIRAIEAGFFGGVAQSRPQSVAPSPMPSRPTSPAMGSKAGTYAPSHGSQSTMYGGSQQQHLADTRSFSASSSKMSHQGQYSSANLQSPNHRIPTNAPPQAYDSKNSRQFPDLDPNNPFRTPSPASSSRSPLQMPLDPSIRVASPPASSFGLDTSSNRSLRQPVNRLAPSNAELNGRLKHAAPQELSHEGSTSPISNGSQTTAGSAASSSSSNDNAADSARQRKGPPPNLNLSNDNKLLHPLSLKPQGLLSPKSPRTPRGLKPPPSPGYGNSTRNSHLSTSTYYPESSFGDQEPPTMQMNQGGRSAHLMVVKDHMSSAVSMAGSIDQEREASMYQPSEYEKSEYARSEYEKSEYARSEYDNRSEYDGRSEYDARSAYDARSEYDNQSVYAKSEYDGQSTHDKRSVYSSKSKRQSAAPTLPPIETSRPGTAKSKKSRRNNRDSTSTFQDLEDYFAKQKNGRASRPRSRTISALSGNYDDSQSEYQEDDRTTTGYYSEEERSTRHQATARGSRATTNRRSIPHSNRTSASYNYPDEDNYDVHVVQVSDSRRALQFDNRRQGVTVQTRLPTGAPF